MQVRLREDWRRGEVGNGERWRVDWEVGVGRGRVCGENRRTNSWRAESGIAEMKFVEEKGPECTTEGHGMHMFGAQK